jgi:hypothetical protein
LLASRNIAASSVGRSGIVTIGGTSQTLDGADNGQSIPNTVTFTGVTGAQLKADGITIYREKTGASDFAYVNAIQIIKE